MKKWMLVLGTVFLMQPIWAQTDDFKFPDIPVSMKLPIDFGIERIGKKAWEVTDGKTVFNVLQYKVSNLFTADSLKKLVLSLYDDPAIENLQVSQIGSGSLGPHSSEKCVVSFRGDGALYLGTYYLVRFHVNKSINSFLFFYDIGEGNAPSYTMLLENMGSSLKNTEFTWATHKSIGDSIQFTYPNFWSSYNSDSTQFLVGSSDERAFTSIGWQQVVDTVSTDTYVETLEKQLKLNATMYPELKLKKGKGKWKDETVRRMSGTYMENVNGLKRKLVFEWMLVRRKLNNTERIYWIRYTYPEFNESYYLPLKEKYFNEVKIPGNPIDK